MGVGAALLLTLLLATDLLRSDRKRVALARHRLAGLGRHLNLPRPPVRGARHRRRGRPLRLPRLHVRNPGLYRSQDLPHPLLLHHLGERRRRLAGGARGGIARPALAGTGAQLLLDPLRERVRPSRAGRDRRCLQSGRAHVDRAVPAAVALGLPRGARPPRSRLARRDRHGRRGRRAARDLDRIAAGLRAGPDRRRAPRRHPVGQSGDRRPDRLPRGAAAQSA